MTFQTSTGTYTSLTTALSPRKYAEKPIGFPSKYKEIARYAEKIGKGDKKDDLFFLKGIQRILERGF